jgi:predicted phage-related endonuclease
MQWGTETEPQARAAYEHRHDCDVTIIGFVHHPKIIAAGASPDGLVGDDGLVELKCPNTATHLDTLLSDTVPDKYVKQMQFQMACAERKWCDFVSFDPRLPEHMRLFVKRVERDDKLIAEIDKEVSAFLAEVDAKLLALVQRYGTKEAA